MPAGNQHEKAVDASMKALHHVAVAIAIQIVGILVRVLEGIVEFTQQLRQGLCVLHE